MKQKHIIVLSDVGKKVFKGGNKKPMSKVIGKIFSTEKKAIEHMTIKLGSGTLYLYDIKETNAHKHHS